MVFGLRKLRAPQTFDENDPLRILLRGRDTSWYKGDLLKINLIIVSRALDGGDAADRSSS